MAFIGLLNPYVGLLVDEEKKIYSDLFMFGEAIRVNVNPNYNEAKLNANNRLKEYVKICFGHEVIDNDSEVIYKTDDMANYVGVGFFADEMHDGKIKYVATILYKVKFGEAANEYSTRGDNIEFKTPSVEGIIAGLKNNEWKRTKIFDTESEADEWLRSILGGKAGSENAPGGTASTAAYKTVAVDK